MRAEEELELQPDRVVTSDATTVIVIVLQAKLRKFSGIPRQIRRNPPARITKGISAVERFVARIVPGDEIAAQSGHPARPKAVEQLRIDAPIGQPLAGHGI